MARFVLILACVAACSCESKLKPGEKYSRAEADAGVASGQPLLAAIFAFEADHGLWPHNLQELVPDYLPNAPSEWHYHTFHHGDFGISYRGRLTGGILHFGHQEWQAGRWQVGWGMGALDVGGNDTLDVTPPPRLPSPLIPKVREKKREAILNARIAREPQFIHHRTGLMKHLAETGRMPDARALCQDCIERWPDYWWLYFMLGKLGGEAEPPLSVLAARWNDFFGYTFLASYYYDCKNTAACREALGKAAKCAPRRMRSYAYDAIGYHESMIDEVYYQHAAKLALAIDERELALALCDRWREYCVTVQHYGGSDEPSVRTASQTGGPVIAVEPLVVEFRYH